MNQVIVNVFAVVGFILIISWVFFRCGYKDGDKYFRKLSSFLLILICILLWRISIQLGGLM